MHYRAKFHRNQLNGCEDIAIFPVFKMAAVCHLGYVCCICGPPTKHVGFLNSGNLNAWQHPDAVMHHYAKFC